MVSSSPSPHNAQEQSQSIPSPDQSTGRAEQQQRAPGSANDSFINVRMPRDVLRELQWLADEMKVDVTVALRYAIATTRFIEREKNDGSKFVIEKNGRQYDVAWRKPEIVSAEMKDAAY